KENTKAVLVVLLCLVSLPADWSCIASLCILAIGTNRGDFKTQMRWMLIYTAMYAVVYIFTIDAVYGILQMAVALSIPVLKLYNGQRGKNRSINKAMKWLFYIYYPLHLLILGLVQRSI
ncbi:MAG: conjugal transfer protein TraX, partial [Oscillospiraceae bacterium]|nr:conjugal transfer protein TraX [Oscillospiraceae bacterium]